MKKDDAQIEDCFVWTISGQLKAAQLDNISHSMEHLMQELQSRSEADLETLGPYEIKISLKSDQVAISVSTTPTTDPTTPPKTGLDTSTPTPIDMSESYSKKASTSSTVDGSKACQYKFDEEEYGWTCQVCPSRHGIPGTTELTTKPSS